MQLLSYGQGYRAAHAAAHYADLLKPVKLCGSTERTYKVVYTVTHVKMVKLFRSCADYLEYYPYGAFFAVITSNGKRYTLSVCVNAQSDKLPGYSLGGYIRSLNVHKSNRRVQVLLVNDLVHYRVFSFFIVRTKILFYAEALITLL